MNKLNGPLEVFFEFIAIGAALGVVGYHFMLSYDVSFIGFFGALAMIYGGWKCMMGLYIFCIYFFALLFKPEWLASPEKKEKSDLTFEELPSGYYSFLEYEEDEEVKYEEVKQVTFLGQLWQEPHLIEIVVLVVLIIFSNQHLS